MTARTVVEGLAGAVLSISATLPATYDAAGYGATAEVFTAVGQIENYGNHGVTATISTFIPIDTAVVAKIKGSKDYGKMALTIGDMPGDAGQVILAAAAESPNHYSVKIIYQDGAKHYLDVLVAKFEYVDGPVNSVKKINVEFDICRAPVIVAAP